MIQKFDEGNLNEFCEHEKTLKKEMDFVMGVSTNVNLNTENYLTDLFESSKLKLLNQAMFIRDFHFPYFTLSHVMS